MVKSFGLKCPQGVHSWSVRRWSGGGRWRCRFRSCVPVSEFPEGGSTSCAKSFWYSKETCWQENDEGGSSGAVKVMSEMINQRCALTGSAELQEFGCAAQPEKLCFFSAWASARQWDHLTWCVVRWDSPEVPEHIAISGAFAAAVCVSGEGSKEHETCPFVCYVAWIISNVSN